MYDKRPFNQRMLTDRQTGGQISIRQAQLIYKQTFIINSFLSHILISSNITLNVFFFQRKELHSYVTVKFLYCIF